MSKTLSHQLSESSHKPKPRQLKRQQLKELLQRDQPQPESRPEQVLFKPMG
jgi:hypothetical protein